MELLADIQTTLRNKYPSYNTLAHEEAAFAVYQKVVEAQGKQEVDDFLRKSPSEVAQSVRNRIATGWSVLSHALTSESPIEDTSSPGTALEFYGMSGIIIYTKP